MVDWLRRLREKEQIQVSAKRETPVPMESILAPLVPVMPRGPDHSQLPSLQPVEITSPLALAPLVIIGVGPVGQAVLEALTVWLPPHPVSGQRPLTLLALRLAGEPMPDFQLPQAIGVSLVPQEQRGLSFDRGRGSYPWYPSWSGDDWKRPDGRLGVFQNLQGDPLALWSILQKHLGDGRQPDVWVVGSTFDAVGSGMIFDLAHLVRLVGEAQNYVPFIGWVLALPSPEWGEEHQPEAAATLRELARLLRADVPRIYEYNNDSTNYKLHYHVARGDEDANVILLCEPPAELYGRQSVESVVSRMALALLTLAQPEVWHAFRDDLRTLGRLRQHPDEALVSAFGICAHYVPLPELQALVRAWLTRDVLLDRQWGVVQAWRPAQVEPDEAAATLVLQQAGHDFLTALAQASSHPGRHTLWPPATGGDQTLALTLRQHLQELADRPLPGNSLSTCDALLAGMEEVLLRASAPLGQIEPLEQVVTQARQELRNWLKLLGAANEMAETVVANAQDQWEQSLARTGFHSVLDKDTASRIYESLLCGTPDIRQIIRQYVRWAWVVEGKHLRLCLDTLYPGWDQATPGWRHAPATDGVAQLWEGTGRVVTAFSQEPRYWPSSLTGRGRTLPSSAEVQQTAGLTLSYDTGVAQAIRMTTKLAYQTSGDKDWLESSWLSEDVTVQRAASFCPTLGLLLQVYHLIPLSAVRSLATLRKRYGNRRGAARTLHIFEPEQLAAEIEKLALLTVPRRRQDTLGSTWLSSRTVAAFQWPELVNLFVDAWLVRLVEPKFGKGPYRLLQPNSVQGSPKEMCSLTGNHPLEAMHAFVLGNQQPTKQEQENLARLFEETPTSRAKKTSVRLDEIAGWWESPDPRNVEWYLLVYGLLGREHS